MNKSESIKELASALSKAQGEIENAAKSTKNEYFKSKYADLAECLNTIRPVFSKNGLSLSQFPSFEGGIVSVESILMHSSGEWMSNIASAPISKQDAQSIGSATTYLRRYSLAAISGIAQEDDDGNYVSGNDNKKKPQDATKAVENGSAMDTCKMAFEALLPHRQTEMRGMADELQSIFASKGINDAYDLKESYRLDNDDTTAIWWLLDSKLRTSLNKRKKELQQLSQGN